MINLAYEEEKSRIEPIIQMNSWLIFFGEK